MAIATANAKKGSHDGLCAALQKRIWPWPLGYLMPKPGSSLAFAVFDSRAGVLLADQWALLGQVCLQKVWCLLCLAG
jgi:hypothetical protein